MIRTAFSRRAARPRRLTPRVDLLEARELLTGLPASGTVLSPTHMTIKPFGSSVPPGSAYTPAQIQQAYGFSSVTFGSAKGDGTGQTIAIVDAYDDPNILTDLNNFSATYGLPAANFTKVNQTGGTTLPTADAGWSTEIALDVEWAHAVAPGAKIVLVEANSSYTSDLLTAVDYAAAHANVVSMSWGGGEFSGQTGSSYDGRFVHAGVSFVASSGDNGAPASWPASSPNVLAVGGTALTIGSGNAYAGESGWSGSGGGPSSYETQPTYQKNVVTQTTTRRANPDVAYDGSPSTGFAVDDSYGSGGWVQVGGTSAGAPQWAALLAIVDQGRAANGQSALNTSGPQDVMTQLYKLAGSADFHDVTTGSSTGTTTYNAGPGYDYVTGIGSPVANLLIPALAGATTPPASSDHLVVTVSTPQVAGSAFSVTVTAQTSTGAADPSYAGTVKLTSSDAQAVLPAAWTFTTADAGSHTFSVTLKTAGSQTVTATDTAGGATAVTSSAITVSPAAAGQFVLSGFASTATVGSPVTFTLTAKDAYGNVATGYAGTVHFTSTDGAATLPADTAFTTAAKGVMTFSVTFATAGTQTVTATDTAAGFAATSSGVSVAPAAPLSLTATAASGSQINLSWSAAAGATGYTVQRSANGSAGWAQVGTTAAGTTTYSDTGLTAGTTYYYRVVATGGGVSSATSNTANATTTGTPPVSGTPASLWPNSYTPSIDSYSYGSYDLGLKFKSDVAGNVTGVRFFKQSWMNGYTHVGYLWNSTGAMLGSATFTNETASGWEQVTFSKSVAVAANTTYIVSFSTGGGYFGYNSTYFAGSGQDSGVLHAPSQAAAAGNGVYATANNRFPNVGTNGLNFWVDVAFTPNTSSARPTVSHATAPATAAPNAAVDAAIAAIATAGTGNVSVSVSVPTAPARGTPSPVTVSVTPRRATPVAQAFGTTRGAGKTSLLFGPEGF